MDQAFFWAKKAADQGLAASECDLAVMYEAGLGAPKDIPQAIIWYRQAAYQGDARAQAALRRLDETRSNIR
jgi:TPR repeat protein